MSRAKKLVLIGVLISLALALHAAERLIPLPMVVPGVKLGLANIVTLVAVFILSLPELALLVLIRTTLSSMFGGGLSGFLFSLSGGMLSMLVMYFLCHRFQRSLSLPAISVVGALFHNIGQLLVASFIVETLGIFFYLPLLIASAGATGLAVGFTSLLLVRALDNARFIRVAPEMRVLFETGSEAR
ncbi:MAG: Gx transporter family protein [Bacillota bacterium]|jgi:heptaprenyl diphosphate synthase